MILRKINDRLKVCERVKHMKSWDKPSLIVGEYYVAALESLTGTVLNSLGKWFTGADPFFPIFSSFELAKEFCITESAKHPDREYCIYDHNHRGVVAISKEAIIRRYD
jgi:hypothetical protein